MKTNTQKNHEDANGKKILTAFKLITG